MLRHSLSCLASSLLLVHVAAQRPEAPRTVPERTAHSETSRIADVENFVDACAALPHGDRIELHVAGKTHEGRGMLLVKVRSTDEGAAPSLRALVIGNIHAGEVEGKEALQQLVREFAQGEHSELLRHVELWLVPVYNVDGNEAVKVGNRRGQNGPDAVGQRANGQGLDLNRDFVKLDAPETRILTRLFREVDPHLFVDLHTTNGSYHGYHLTYAPSLNANVDRGVDRLSRELLEATRAAMRGHGFETFDYGNFETRDWDGGGAPESKGRGWFTYDHRARYGTNYFALRNRVAVLSEAYSYCDFATRIAATRAFVLTLLQQLVARRDDALETMRDADERLTRGDAAWFGSATVFAEAEQLPVLVGEVERVQADDRPLRLVRGDEATPETMPVVRRFRATRQRRLPRAWAVQHATAEVKQRLQWHGVTFTELEQGATRRAERFAVDKKRKPKRPFQGHQELVLEGHWQPAEDLELLAGTLIVPADQPLARLAATLLEPESEDSLSSWNFLEDQTGVFYPVLRLR